MSRGGIDWRTKPLTIHSSNRSPYPATIHHVELHNERGVIVVKTTETPLAFEVHRYQRLLTPGVIATERIARWDVTKKPTAMRLLDRLDALIVSLRVESK